MSAKEPFWNEQEFQTRSLFVGQNHLLQLLKISNQSSKFLLAQIYAAVRGHDGFTLVILPRCFVNTREPLVGHGKHARHQPEGCIPPAAE